MSYIINLILLINLTLLCNSSSNKLIRFERHILPQPTQNVSIIKEIKSVEEKVPVLQFNTTIKKVDTNLHNKINETQQAQEVEKSKNEKTEEKQGKKEITNELNDTSIINPKMREEVVQSGALIRGLIVFVVLSILILIYFAFRHYRLASGKNATSIVHKYGVRTCRSDIEMLPLPLDEDEDDDTVFDVANHSNQ